MKVTFKLPPEVTIRDLVDTSKKLRAGVSPDAVGGKPVIEMEWEGEIPRLGDSIWGYYVVQVVWNGGLTCKRRVTIVLSRMQLLAFQGWEVT